MSQPRQAGNPEPAPPPPQEVAPSFRLVRPLSFGPATEVWEARLDGRAVVARRHVPPQGGLPWPTPPDPDRLAALRHPALARYLVSIPDPQGARIDVFLPVPGPTLKTLLRTGPLPPTDWVPLLRAAAIGLRWLHDRNPAGPLLHGDVAPSNLVVPGPGRARWIDIGAFVPGTWPAGRDIVWGTLAVTAPEVLAGGAPDRASEVYSLGLLALACEHGRLPWADARTPEDSLAHPARSRIVAMASRMTAPSVLADLLAGMLAREPGRRPTMSQVVAAWPKDRNQARNPRR